MKVRKIVSLIASTVCLTTISACGSSIPANRVNSLVDLDGKVIAVQLGTTGDAYASDVSDAEVKRFNKASDAVKALEIGDVDAVLVDLEPAKFLIEGNRNLKILDEAFSEEQYAVAVSKSNPELTEKINGALAELQADGTLDAIKDYWINSNDGYASVTLDPNAPNGTLKMVTNAEFPPYESLEGEEIIGFDIDMMKAVCDRLDMNLEIENMDFDSLLQAVSSGMADIAAAGITVNDERLEIVDFTDSYTTSSQVLIVRKK